MPTFLDFYGQRIFYSSLCLYYFSLSCLTTFPHWLELQKMLHSCGDSRHFCSVLGIYKNISSISLCHLGEPLVDICREVREVALCSSVAMGLGLLVSAQGWPLAAGSGCTSDAPGRLMGSVRKMSSSFKRGSLKSSTSGSQKVSELCAHPGPPSRSGASSQLQAVVLCCPVFAEPHQLPHGEKQTHMTHRSATGPPAWPCACHRQMPRLFVLVAQL